MMTTYQAAFGTPHAQKPVVESLIGGRKKPDTSSDAVIAAALAEEERAGAANPDGPASPSGVRLHLPLWEADRNQGQGQQQRRSVPGDTHVLTDAELARHLQRAELQAAADAAGTTPSLMFPDFLSQLSSRELALNKTLGRAPSVRVNPRVAAAALPDEPVVSADRARLLETLRKFDLLERQVAGDGNCQFRSLSDQLYGTPEYHAAVRSDVLGMLKQRKQQYGCYVPGEYGEYCSSMAKSGTWGDHVTLQAAADHYGVKIVVVTSFAESPVINIEPEQARSPRTLYLSFWAEVHYNSLYPAQEPPPPPVAPPPLEDKPPKVLGSRTLGRVVQEVEKVTAPVPKTFNRVMQEVKDVATAPLSKGR